MHRIISLDCHYLGTVCFLNRLEDNLAAFRTCVEVRLQQESDFSRSPTSAGVRLQQESDFRRSPNFANFT
ncbi:uncharacterized protein LOC143032712 isoform X5 [Oratosquilla oratoria]|uniref:uncharacterized protein LOC143032712 isoform X5 n=1 Tax=Oratosquilla oratoria TaxID=337810 RepID=UPI003F7714BD